MLIEICDILKDKLVQLPFLDKVAGLVKPVSMATPSDSNAKNKIFPVAANVSYDDCKKGRFTDLVPNSTKMGIAYFEEEQAATVVKDQAAAQHYQAQVRLVVWLNLQKLGEKELSSLSSIALQNVTKLLHNFHLDLTNSGIRYVRARQVGEVIKLPSIFSKYTYSEAETQYLFYPFDYFAVSYRINFAVFDACVPLLNPKTPDPCIQ